VTVTDSRQFYRQDGRVDSGPTGGPRPVAAVWVERAQAVACEQAAWRTAVDHDRKKGSNDAPAMAKLGMGVVGQFRHPFELDEMLWANT